MNKKRKLLIVDDDSVALEIAKEGINEKCLGIYEILVAEGGAQGIAIATSERPDIILLDLSMPDINGFEVLDELSKRGVETRVVIWTGRASYQNIETAVRCVKHGACDFITKPIDLDEIYTVLKRSLALDTTLNMSILNSSPSVKKLVGETEHLDRQLANVTDELNRLRRRSYAKDVISKSVLLLIAATVSFALKSTGAFTSEVTFLTTLVILFVLLLIPWGRLQSVEAQSRKLKARLAMQSLRKEEDRPN